MATYANNAMLEAMFGGNYKAAMNQYKNNPELVAKLSGLRDTKLTKLYGNDYQAEINRRAALDSNDPMIPDLQRLRAVKIGNQQPGTEVIPRGRSGAPVNTRGTDLGTTDTAATVVDNARPSLRSGADLANLYGGITFDEQAILNKFNNATNAEYAMLNKEYGMTEDKFYNRMADMQSTALDTIRKSNAKAVATGASRGMQAANELSAMLSTQQAGVDEATQLAQQRNLLKDKEAAALMKNVVDAFTQSNATKFQLGNLGTQQYAADTQFGVGEMDYYARLDQAAKNLQGMGLQANATKYTADQNLAGSRYTADQNLAGNRYVADQNLVASQYTADQNLAGNKYVADQNLTGSKYTADQNLTGNRYVADKNYAGTMYSADAQKAAAAAQAAAQIKAAGITAAGYAKSGYSSNSGSKSEGIAIADALKKFKETGDYDAFMVTAGQLIGADAAKQLWNSKSVKGKVGPEPLSKSVPLKPLNGKEYTTKDIGKTIDYDTYDILQSLNNTYYKK